MLNRYRLYRRDNGVYYWQDNNDSSKQGSLKTRDKEIAEKLLHSKNESHRQPSINLAIARTYLAASDPKMNTRTWAAVMAEMCTHGIESTRERCQRAVDSQEFDSLRDRPLVQTTAEEMLAQLHKNTKSFAHYLRRLHNLAMDIGWLAWPILTKRAWPKVRSGRKRAITAQEHAKILASEKNEEKRAYYDFLYETGAAQTDAAEMMAEKIDWTNGLLVYRRKKLKEDSEPARLTIGKRLREILETRPKCGPLFPTIKSAGANARATEFKRRCRIAGVSGVTLHSYRHSWAQRAKKCGYPQRFAQDALGHSSRAVHEAYAKGAQVVLPPLDQYEELAAKKIITMPRVSIEAETQIAVSGT